MDYSLFASAEILSSKVKSNEVRLNNLRANMDFVLDSVLALTISTESMEVVQEGFTDSLKELFQNIIAFFKDIFGVFRKTSEEKTTSFRDWMKENSDILDSVDMNNITVEITPYWEGDSFFDKGLDNISAVRDEYLNKIVSKAQEAKKANSMVGKLKTKLGIAVIESEEDLLKKHPRLRPMVDKENDIINGAKNYFRLGNPDDSSKRVTLTGSSLKTQLDVMERYCTNYSNKYVKRIEDEASRIENAMKKVEQQLAVVAEGSYADIVYSLHSLNPLLEADAPPANNVTAITTNKTTADANTTNKPATTSNTAKTASGKPEAAKIVDNTDKNAVDKNSDEAKIATHGKEHLKALNILFGILKKVLSAAMSIAEEKFVRYFDLIKQVASKGASGKKDEANQEDTTDTKETPAKDAETTKATKTTKKKKKTNTKSAGKAFS